MIELNKIYNEDCLKGLKKLPDESIDVVFTSPPYADRRKNSYEGCHHTVYNEWFVEIAKEIKRILKPTGSFFLNLKPHCEKGERLLYVYELVIKLRNKVGFKFVDEFSWTKNGVPGRFVGRFKNAFEPVFHFKVGDKVTFNPYEVAEPMKEESIARANRKASGESENGSGFAGMRRNETMQNKKLALPSNHIHIPQKSNQFALQSKHPAVFPVELPEFFIKAFSNENDVVLDPFIGSGTTAIAAINTNRNYIGFELEEEYYDLANERIKNHTTYGRLQ
ncbi:DNA-methyltransferase [Oceanobacillus sp. FSL H7-0719]|uniref:DNA-methyltransferase n=1 Tax=Oceanobacillus sp. FSL H7-0719 TaxID=2954507 RepID=UPI003250AEB8